MSLLEVVVYDVRSAVAAASCGVDRLEICDNHREGGTTPSFGTVSVIMEKLDTPVFPMIRPRGGDFLYNEDEIRVMLQDIKAFKNLGCKGIVLGALQVDGTVDSSNVCKMVDAAYPMDVTFHRAFDRTRDFGEALFQIFQSGCSRILTSGGQPSVKEGVSRLKEIQTLAKGKLKIIAGGGVERDVIPTLLSMGIDEIHTPAKSIISSEMDFVNIDMKETLEHISIDVEELKAMVGLVKS